MLFAAVCHTALWAFTVSQWHQSSLEAEYQRSPHFLGTQKYSKVCDPWQDKTDSRTGQVPQHHFKHNVTVIDCRSHLLLRTAYWGSPNNQSSSIFNFQLLKHHGADGVMVSKSGHLSLGETTYSALISIVKVSLAKKKSVKIMTQILPPKGKLQKLKYQENKKILCDQML